MVGTIVVSWQNLNNFFFLILQMYLGRFRGQGIDFNIWVDLEDKELTLT